VAQRAISNTAQGALESRALRHSLRAVHCLRIIEIPREICMTASITERIDQVTKIPPHYLKAELPAPRSVKIEISPRCN
jgi:hypothetical protein